ncbi:hypothetical protein CC79DRAFT_1364395 [Sarocladium strictum]
MPPRRSHKKSRAGCRRCKNRKIKCDEVHPRCGNCLKHGVACDFEHPDLRDELTPAPTPSLNLPDSPPQPVTPAPTLNIPQTPAPFLAQPSPSPMTVTPLMIQPSLPRMSRASIQVDRLTELRLLHQYTTSTCHTLNTGAPTTQDIWQIAVPRLAFSGGTFLMDAMLSVAALHLRSQEPGDKALVRASHAYAASTLAEYCKLLDNGITADNAEALFLTATLIAFQASGSRIFLKEDADSNATEPGSRYVLPLPWFHAFQGVKTVVASSWQWIRMSTTVKAVIDAQPSFQLDMNPTGPGSFFGHLLDGLDREMATEDANKITSSSQAYSHAVCVLNWAHKNPTAGASLAFPATVSRRFIELVEVKRPRALAILACFFALLKRLDGVWWLQDVTRREVMGLVGLFEPGSSWWRHLEWPIRIAVWENGPIPADVWGAACDGDGESDEGLAGTMLNHVELMADLVKQKYALPQVQVNGDILSVASPD